MKPSTVCVYQEDICWWLLKRSSTYPWNQLGMFHSSEYVKLSRTFCSSAWPSLQGFMRQLPWQSCELSSSVYNIHFGQKPQGAPYHLVIRQIIAIQKPPHGTVTKARKCAHTTWECVGWHSLLITGKKHEPFFFQPHCRWWHLCPAGWGHTTLAIKGWLMAPAPII